MASFGVADYSGYLSLFSPLLQQQAALFQATAQNAAAFAAYQHTIAATQERQRAEERAKKVDTPSPIVEEAPQSVPPLPSEPIPIINIYSPDNQELTNLIESEWRWSTVCIFFEQFLPLYPNTIGFKPELLLQSFLCQHHSCSTHKWNECSCTHPACIHLAELFLQLLLLLHPIPRNCKKLPKNQLNIANFLPLLQSIIEKQFFLPDQNGTRENIQQIMELYIDACEEKKARAKESERFQAESEGKMTDVDATDTTATTAHESSNSLKFVIPIHPPGSAILASHLHQLPAMCKLYLLHFLCEHVLSELPDMKEACNLSNTLYQAGDEQPEAPRDDDDASTSKLPRNPFHSLGLSEPHGVDDEGARYWCFVQQESNRIHLYKDIHTGAKSELSIQMKRCSGAAKRPALTHGYEKEERELERLAASLDGDGESVAMAEDDEPVDGDEDDYESDTSEAIDIDHAPPTFQFTLLTHDFQAVQDFVQIGLTMQRKLKSIKFLQRLQTDVLPNAVLMQKKFERLQRREKAAALVTARQAAQAAGEAQQAVQRSQRVRKAVNYQELNEGDGLYRLDSSDVAADAPAPITTAADRATRFSRRSRGATPNTPTNDTPIPNTPTTETNNTTNTDTNMTDGNNETPATPAQPTATTPTPTTPAPSASTPVTPAAAATATPVTTATAIPAAAVTPVSLAAPVNPTAAMSAHMQHLQMQMMYNGMLPGMAGMPYFLSSPGLQPRMAITPTVAQAIPVVPAIAAQVAAPATTTTPTAADPITDDATMTPATTSGTSLQA